MAPRAAFVSFRFGPTDGVSVVARTWMAAFEHFGFDVVTVTGDEGSDRTVPGLGIVDPGAETESEPPDRAQLDKALSDADLVVVENLLTIPLNLPASRVTAQVLAGRPALVHHHDPPWHRERFAHITELPATDPAWRHVAVNGLLSRELAERGIDAVTIHNGFEIPDPVDLVARREARDHVRRAVGLPTDATVVAHPVRAIDRKNLPDAIALAEALEATYWLLGPAEEGYGPELERLIAHATCPVVHRPWPDPFGIYAAADHIAFPSTWEGFGNPPIEAALYRRPVTVGHYPVADELRAFGFSWFDPGDVDGVRRFLADPDSETARSTLDRNEHIARTHFSIDRVRDQLAALLTDAGWMP